MTASWDEATVTWDTQPTYDPASVIGTAQVPASVETWMEWDATGEPRLS